jgi:hypothetical protein
VVYAAALVDRLLPPFVHADVGREDEVGTYRAGKVVEGRRLLRRDLPDDLDEASRAPPTRVRVNDAVAGQPELA